MIFFIQYKQRLFYGFILLLIVCLTIWFVLLPRWSGVRESGVHLESKTSQNELVKQKANNLASPKNDLLVEKKKIAEKSLFMTPAELEVVHKWYFNHGYDFAENSVYQSYSPDILQQLADSGDVIAMDYLAKYYSSEKLDFKTATDLYTKAAVYGSTRALVSLGNNIDALNFTTKNEDKKRKTAMNAFVLYEVAALRGDRLALSDETRTLDLTLSANDWQEIKTTAKDIYNKFQEERTKQGLGNFDNTLPPEVETYFLRMEGK